MASTVPFSWDILQFGSWFCFFSSVTSSLWPQPLGLTGNTAPAVPFKLPWDAGRPPYPEATNRKTQLCAGK